MPVKVERNVLSVQGTFLEWSDKIFAFRLELKWVPSE